MDVLLDAASHAESDPMRGVSENIILGQLPRIGTGILESIFTANIVVFPFSFFNLNFA